MKQKLIISIILLLSSFGIFLYVDRKSARQNANISDLSWEHYRKDKLTKIISTIYRGTNQRQYTLEKENGEWLLKSPINLSLFPEKALALANSFLTLRPKETYSNVTLEDKKSYGLETPLFKISGVFDEKTYSFLIGNPTSIGDHYYIQDLNNSNNVYLINKEQLKPFMDGASALINNYFLVRSTDDIMKVSFLNNKNLKIELENTNHFWVQTSPESNNQVDWGTRKFLLGLRDLSFDAKQIIFDVSEENLQRFGINKEKSPQIQLVFDDNTTNTLIVGELTKGFYPVYIEAENIISFSDRNSVDMVFNVTLDDFKNRTKQ